MADTVANMIKKVIVDFQSNTVTLFEVIINH